MTKGISFEKLNVPTIPGFLPVIGSTTQLDFKKPLRSPYQNLLHKFKKEMEKTRKPGTTEAPLRIRKLAQNAPNM